MGACAVWQRGGPVVPPVPVLPGAVMGTGELFKGQLCQSVDQAGGKVPCAVAACASGRASRRVQLFQYDVLLLGSSFQHIEACVGFCIVVYILCLTLVVDVRWTALAVRPCRASG